MASHILSSIYRIGDNDLKSAPSIPATQGVPHSFPTVGVRFYPITTGTVTANGVTMNSIIALLPTGLNQPEKKFYTPTTVTDLNTAANTADA